MKRFRGKVWVTFNSGKTISVEHVAIAKNIEDATKICEIEFNGSYLENKNVKSYQILPCIEDNTEKPSYDFVKDNLLKANDICLSTLNRERAESDIRKAFFNYQPSYKDDFLLDVFSYCEEGILDQRFDIDEITNRLLYHLDKPFSCHYRPDRSLKNQYKTMEEKIKEVTGHTKQEKNFTNDIDVVIENMSRDYNSGEYDNNDYLDGYINAIWNVKTILEENKMTSVIIDKEKEFENLINKEEKEYYSQIQDSGIADDLHNDYYDGFIKGIGDMCKMLEQKIPDICETYMENNQENLELD